MHDVAVVGAGPSGSYCAYLCAKAGLDTLVLERKKLPREKACGGVTSKRVIERLGPRISEVIERKGLTNRVFFEYDRVAEISEEEYFFKRSRFDYFITSLAMDAGAEVIDDCPVERIKVAKEAVLAVSKSTVYPASVVVGADGVYSTVGKSIGLSHNYNTSYAALRMEIEMRNEEIDRLLETETSSNMNTYFFRDLLGFAWLIPYNGILNAGIGALARKSTGLRRKFQTFLRKVGIDGQGKVMGHMIPYALLPRISAKRVLLVGDAGGFVNPWTGSGIELGLFSAEKAARACIHMIECNDFSDSAAEMYSRSCRTNMRNLSFRSKLISLLDNHTPSSFVLPRFSRDLVKHLCRFASLKL